MELSNRSQGIGEQQRWVLMDGLRGLALFGILLVNLRLMSAPSMAFGDLSLWSGAWSEGALLLSAFLFDGAFWTLFALLFGAGFGVMMGSTPPPLPGEGGRSGPPPLGIGLPAYRRRLFLIGCFGLLHVLLLWYGDILMIYALAGIALPWFVGRRTRTLLLWAVHLILLPAGLMLLMVAGASLLPAEELADLADWVREDSEGWVQYLTESYRSADFGVLVRARVEEYCYDLWSVAALVPTALGVMLLGMLLGRQGRFRLDAAQGGFFRKLFWWALPCALVGKLAYTFAHAFWIRGGDLFSFQANAGFVLGFTMGGLASAGVLLCGVRAWYRSAVGVWLQDSLASAGRMALTLYLMQSLIAGFIFNGYGLGLYGEVPPYALWGIGVVIFAGQLLFARFWFARFAKGPLEYLLRRFTYWG